MKTKSLIIVAAIALAAQFGFAAAKKAEEKNPRKPQAQESKHWKRWVLHLTSH
ncbi:MAG: hypothetical protein R2877_00485 [Bdellovibrionota bacterium]